MKYLAFVYLLVGVITFGSAWHHNPKTEDRPLVSASEMNQMEAFGCAVAWPLYWSYRAFEPKPKL